MAARPSEIRENGTRGQQDQDARRDGRNGAEQIRRTRNRVRDADPHAEIVERPAPVNGATSTSEISGHERQRGGKPDAEGRLDRSRRKRGGTRRRPRRCSASAALAASAARPSEAKTRNFAGNRKLRSGGTSRCRIGYTGSSRRRRGPRRRPRPPARRTASDGVRRACRARSTAARQRRGRANRKTDRGRY